MCLWVSKIFPLTGSRSVQPSLDSAATRQTHHVTGSIYFMHSMRPNIDDRFTLKALSCVADWIVADYSVWPLYHILVLMRPCRYRALDAGRGDWQTISVSSANDQLSLTVYRLKPATLYQFMVVSRSLDTGDPLFSSPVNATTKGNRRRLQPEILIQNSQIIE